MKHKLVHQQLGRPPLRTFFTLSAVAAFGAFFIAAGAYDYFIRRTESAQINIREAEELARKRGMVFNEEYRKCLATTRPKLCWWRRGDRALEQAEIILAAKIRVLDTLSDPIVRTGMSIARTINTKRARKAFLFVDGFNSGSFDKEI